MLTKGRVGAFAVFAASMASPGVAILDGTPYPSDNTGFVLLFIPTVDPNDDPALGYSCSGTLLRKNWVLTAKHCVQQNSQTVNAGTISVMTATRSYCS